MSVFVSGISRILLCISTAHTIYLRNAVDIFLACANAHMAKVNNRNLEVPNYILEQYATRANLKAVPYDIQLRQTRGLAVAIRENSKKSQLAGLL